MSNEQSNHDLNDELLSAYIDGELSPELRAQVEQRLRTDPQARQLVEELRGLSGAIKALPREKFAGDLRPRVWAEVDAADAPIAGKIEQAPRDRWAGFRRGLAWSAVAIAATLVLMIVQPEGEDGRNRELARVDAPSEPPAEAKSEMAQSAPRGRSGPPEMGAPAPGVEGELAATRSAPPPAPQEDSPALQSEMSAAPSAETLADVAGDLAPLSATSEAPAAPSGEPAVARPSSEAPAALATIDATALSSGSLAKFERLLAENQIEVDEAPAATEKGELAPQAAGATAMLVEASPAQLAAVVSALRADRQRFADVRLREEPSYRRGMAKAAEGKDAHERELSEILAEATAGEKSPANAAARTATPGRAWRVRPEVESMVAEAYSAKPSAPTQEAAESLAATAAAGAAPSTSRSEKEKAGEATPDLVRVWFVLRAPQPAAAPPE